MATIATIATPATMPPIVPPFKPWDEVKAAEEDTGDDGADAVLEDLELAEEVNELICAMLVPKDVMKRMDRWTDSRDDRKCGGPLR